MRKIIIWGVIVLEFYCARNIFAQMRDSSFSSIINSVKESLLKQEYNFNILNNKLNRINEILLEIEQKVLDIDGNLNLLMRKNVQNTKDIMELDQIYKDQQSQLDSLGEIITMFESNIKSFLNEVTDKIKEVETKTTREIQELDHSLGKNMLYSIIGFLSLSFFTITAYILICKRIAYNKDFIGKKFNEVRKSLEKEMIKIDSKLISLLGPQPKSIETQKDGQVKINNEPDHSLALKVANEIVRMEKNLARVDKGFKGVKPLLKGLERIKDSLAANGYEILDLVGKEYDDRMNVEVINFLFDENIQKGKSIITKVIKPQVNYDGVLIQRAQVEVSHN